MATVSCPACGGTEDLAGVDAAEGRVIVCGACGDRWQRDTTPTCTLCGSINLEAVPTSTLEEAGRGEQRTPSGIRDAYRCWSCGARDATSSSPIPAGPDWRRTVARPGVHRRPTAGPDEDAPRRAESAFGRFEGGGTIGDRWEVRSLLRWTSTGSLWEATAADTGTRVVFKLLHRRLGAETVAAHAASARAVTGVVHPHLLRVLDVLRRGEDVLLVLEPVVAPTLAEVGTVPADRLGRLVAGLAQALAALHDHRLAHLGIRPANVLVPGDGPARLVDLGSGRVRARARTTPDDARLAWLAPEQILAHEHRAPADVYALGLTLWVAAGGRLDQLGATTAAQASTRLREDVPRLDGGASPLGAAAIDAITAATRRLPAERPTARELADRLV